MTLRSVWDWSEQFGEKDVSLFYNALYDLNYVDRLEPEHKLPMIEVWSLCYYRWIPHLEIPLGGKPQIDLFMRAIITDINNLQQELLKSRDLINGLVDTNDFNELRSKVNSFFPFSHNDVAMSAILSLNSSLMTTGDQMTLDTQSLLNAPD